MLKKIVLYLIIGGTFSLFGFQLYTMHQMVFRSEEAINQENKEYAIRHGREDSNKIAFTCNVDWGEDVLPGMLDIFAEEGIKITFFVSGKWAKKNPWLLRKIYVSGHEVQNHGYGHRLCSKISDKEILDEIIKTEDAVENLIGVKTNIFAPPSGDMDDRTVNVCKELGYSISLWSIDTIDWRPGSTKDVIINRVINKKLNGGILLMHPKEETLKALPSLINHMKEQGLEIVPLWQLIEDGKGI